MYFRSVVVVVMFLCVTKASTIERENKNHYVVEKRSNDNVNLGSKVDTQLDRQLKNQFKIISSMKNKKLKDDKREDFFTLAIMAGLMEILHKTAQKDKITEDVKNGIGDTKNNNFTASRLDKEISEVSEFLHRMSTFKDVKDVDQDMVTVEDIERSVMIIQNAFNVTILHDELENGNKIEADNLIERTLQTLNTSFHEDLRNRKPNPAVNVIWSSPGVTIPDETNVADTRSPISKSGTNTQQSTQTKVGYIIEEVKKKYVDIKNKVQSEVLKVDRSFAFVENFRNILDHKHNDAVPLNEPLKSDNVFVRAAASINNMLSFFGKFITGKK